MYILKQYLTIFLLALILRFILMPLFFHPDLKTQYFHANFLSQGIFNIYDFVAKNKTSLPYKDTFNYPPLSYFFLGTWNLITNPLLGDSYQSWIKNWDESWFTSKDIFKILFILKIPYLFFDLLTGIFIAAILEEKFRKKALILWFFNPISLYIIYGISNFDIIPTFFTLLAVYYLKKENFLSSGLSLGLAISSKVYPILYLPFFIILFLKNRKIGDFLKFSIATLIPVFVTFVPFVDYITNASNSGFTAKILDLKLPLTPIPVFLAIYIVSLLISLKQSVNFEKVCFYILTTCLIIFGVSKFHPQWLIWAIPFFVIFAARNLKLLILSIPFLLGYVLSIINFEDRFVTLGILSPILPDIYNVGSLEETIFSIINKNLFFYMEKFFIVFGIGIVILTILKNYWKSFTFNPSAKKIFSVLLVLDFLIFISMMVLGLFYSSDRILVSSQLKNVKTEDIYRDHDVIYKFKADEGLNLAFIQLKNPGFFNTDPFIFSIEEANGETLTQLNFSGRNLGDGDFVKFQFPPLRNVTNKELILRLKSPTEDRSKIIQVVTDDGGVINHKIFRQGNIFYESPKLIENFLTRFSEDKQFLIVYLSLLLLLTFTLIFKNKSNFNK